MLLVLAAGGTGNIVQVEGRMDFTKYEEILEANVQRSVQTLNLKGSSSKTMIQSIP